MAASTSMHTDYTSLDDNFEDISALLEATDDSVEAELLTTTTEVSIFFILNLNPFKFCSFLSNVFAKQNLLRSNQNTGKFVEHQSRISKYPNVIQTKQGF